MKTQLESKENFEVEGKLMDEIKKLKEELYHSRMGEAKLKLKIAEYQKKGSLIRRRYRPIEQRARHASFVYEGQLEAL